MKEKEREENFNFVIKSIVSNDPRMIVDNKRRKGTDIIINTATNVELQVRTDRRHESYLKCTTEHSHPGLTKHSGGGKAEYIGTQSAYSYAISMLTK